MLKKKYRLGSKTKIKFEKFFSSSFYSLKTSKNNLSYNRYRFVVSKKIDKKAVVRNKIKRMLNSCMENIFGEVKTGYDMIFIAKKEINSIVSQDLCLNIKTLFTRESLIK